MFNSKNIDFKEVLKSPWVNRVSKQVATYEKRLRVLVNDLDLKSREAREKSKQRLDEFQTQVKRTRSDVEKRVVTLVNEEAVRLNKHFADVLSYLKSLANREKLNLTSKGQKRSGAKGAGKKARAASGRSTRSTGERKKKAAPRKRVLHSVGSNGDNGSSLPN